MTKPIAVVQSCSAVLDLDAKKWIKQTIDIQAGTTCRDDQDIHICTTTLMGPTLMPTFYNNSRA